MSNHSIFSHILGDNACFSHSFLYLSPLTLSSPILFNQPRRHPFLIQLLGYHLLSIRLIFVTSQQTILSILYLSLKLQVFSIFHGLKILHSRILTPIPPYLPQSLIIFILYRNHLIILVAIFWMDGLVSLLEILTVLRIFVPPIPLKF